MMHGKSNLTKYEQWKRKTKDSIYSELSKIFDKSFQGCYSLRVSNVNKWNINFLISLPSALGDDFANKINTNEALRDTVIIEKQVKADITTKFISFNYACRISAKTEDDLNSKLMYMNLMF